MPAFPRTALLAAGLVAGSVSTLVAQSFLPAAAAATPSSPPDTLRPVEVTLHRFDFVPGKEATYRDWIDFLHRNHREAVATLPRERTYFEAMFRTDDDPGRLYWITVQGAGGAHVDSSDLELDRKHVAYLDAVLAKGSHRRFTTQNVLMPDFVVAAIRREQQRE